MSSPDHPHRSNRLNQEQVDLGKSYAFLANARTNLLPTETPEDLQKPLSVRFEELKRAVEIASNSALTMPPEPSHEPSLRSSPRPPIKPPIRTPFKRPAETLFKPPIIRRFKPRVRTPINPRTGPSPRPVLKPSPKPLTAQEEVPFMSKPSVSKNGSVGSSAGPVASMVHKRHSEGLMNTVQDGCAPRCANNHSSSGSQLSSPMFAPDSKRQKRAPLPPPSASSSLKVPLPSNETAGASSAAQYEDDLSLPLTAPPFSSVPDLYNVPLRNVNRSGEYGLLHAVLRAQALEQALLSNQTLVGASSDTTGANNKGVRSNSTPPTLSTLPTSKLASRHQHRS